MKRMFVAVVGLITFSGLWSSAVAEQAYTILPKNYELWRCHVASHGLMIMALHELTPCNDQTSLAEAYLIFTSSYRSKYQAWRVAQSLSTAMAKAKLLDGDNTCGRIGMAGTLLHDPEQGVAVTFRVRQALYCLV